MKNLRIIRLDHFPTSAEEFHKLLQDAAAQDQAANCGEALDVDLETVPTGFVDANCLQTPPVSNEYVEEGAEQFTTSGGAKCEGAVFEAGRRNPYPAWDTSYTKRVVDNVRRAYPITLEFERTGVFAQTGLFTPSLSPQPITDALALLEDYHKTNHHVYEERDRLREEVEQLKSEKAELLQAVQAGTEILRLANSKLLSQNDELNRLGGMTARIVREIFGPDGLDDKQSLNALKAIAN